MQSHDLMREVLDQVSAKQIAAEMGLSLSLIYKWAEPPDPAVGRGATNPLDRVETLMRCCNDSRIVQWICEKAGGFFVKNPKLALPPPDYLVPATNQIVKEFADLLAVIATAAVDNRVTREEAENIRGRWEELKTVTEGFVQCCEQGNFGPLRERARHAASTALRHPPAH
jgi:hypothetical protein